MVISPSPCHVSRRPQYWPSSIDQPSPTGSRHTETFPHRHAEPCILERRSHSTEGMPRSAIEMSCEPCFAVLCISPTECVELCTCNAIQLLFRLGRPFRSSTGIHQYPSRPEYIKEAGLPKIDICKPSALRTDGMTMEGSKTRPHGMSLGGSVRCRQCLGTRTHGHSFSFTTSLHDPETFPFLVPCFNLEAA